MATEEVKPQGEDSTLVKPECMERWPHRWQWIWENGEMTNFCRCTTCGITKEHKMPQHKPEGL